MQDRFTLTESSPMGRVVVHRDYASILSASGLTRFSDWMGLNRISYREVSMRPLRPVVALDLPGMPRTIFLKRHLESPRAETIFEKMHLTSPLSEAAKEVQKLEWFEQAGLAVPEVIVWGEGTWEGIGKASFLGTLDLEALPLERFLFHHWKPPVPGREVPSKWGIIEQLAGLTRRMHQEGIVHRDFYLGHVFISEHPSRQEFELSVIDVQRASRRPSWWLRSQIKDLASLHFSADPAFIRPVDRLRFLKAYWRVERLGTWHRFLIGLIQRKALKIRRHTEKAMGIPYSEFFKNKYY